MTSPNRPRSPLVGGGPRPVVPKPRAPVTTRKRGIPLDVAAKHGPVWGAINIAGWVLFGGVVGVFFHVPWWFAVAWGFVGLIVAEVVAADKRYNWQSLVVRGVCWAGGTGWLTWVLAFRPAWSIAACGLVAGAIVLGTASPLAAKRRKPKPTDQVAPTTLTERGQDWVDRIARLSKNALLVRVPAIQDWDPFEEGEASPGYTVEVDLNGVSWRKLVPLKDDLEADLKLQVGCGVSIRMGAHRGKALIAVTTLNLLNQERSMPVEYGPLSMLGGLFYGWARDGARLFGDIRESAWMIVARKGGGKTTLLHALIAWLTRCVDTVIVVIDLNQGGVGVPWCLAWWEDKDDQVDNPAIDWIAGDPVEAGWLAEAMLAVALGRKRRSNKLKRLFNTTLMPIGNGLSQLVNGTKVTLPPAIVIVVDEGRQIFGDQTQYREIRRVLLEVQALARDVGAELIITGLDGTSSSIDGFVKKQCTQRICGPVVDEAEIGYVLDWNTGMRPEDMPRSGVGLARVDGATTPLPFRVPNMLPADIYEYSIKTARLRPTFTPEDIADIDSAIGAGKYARRWERARYLFEDKAGDDSEETPDVTPNTEPDKSTPPPRLEDAMQNMAEKLQAVRDEADRVEAEEGESDSDPENTARQREIDQLESQLRLPPPAPTDWKAQAAIFLAEAGTRGIGPQALADKLKAKGFRTVRQTAFDWLNDEVREGRAAKLQAGLYVIRRES